MIDGQGANELMLLSGQLDTASVKQDSKHNNDAYSFCFYQKKKCLIKMQKKNKNNNV